MSVENSKSRVNVCECEREEERGITEAWERKWSSAVGFRWISWVHTMFQTHDWITTPHPSFPLAQKPPSHLNSAVLIYICPAYIFTFHSFDLIHPDLKLSDNTHSSMNPEQHSPLPRLSASASASPRSVKGQHPREMCSLLTPLCWNMGIGDVGALSAIWSHGEISVEKQSSDAGCQPLCHCCKTQSGQSTPHASPQLFNLFRLFSLCCLAGTGPGQICHASKSEWLRLPFHQKSLRLRKEIHWSSLEQSHIVW